MSKAPVKQAQRRGRDEALASPRMCPPASQPSEGAAGHPLPSPSAWQMKWGCLVLRTSLACQDGVAGRGERKVEKPPLVMEG